MVHHCATPRNLHVLVIEEEGRRVHTGAYSTHTDMLQAWRDWVCGAATQETALDEELRELAAMDDVPDIEAVVDDLSAIDLIEWWQNRNVPGGNDALFYEVQDRRN